MSYAGASRAPQGFVGLLRTETHDDDPWSTAGRGQGPLAVRGRLGTKRDCHLADGDAEAFRERTRAIASGTSCSAGLAQATTRTSALRGRPLATASGGSIRVGTMEHPSVVDVIKWGVNRLVGCGPDPS